MSKRLGKRPSGFEQQKKARGGKKVYEINRGSIFRYVSKNDDGEGDCSQNSSHGDTTVTSTSKSSSRDTSMLSTEKENIETVEREMADEYGETRVEFNLESVEFELRGENESRDKCVTMEMEDVSGGHDECGSSHNSESNVGSDNLQMFRDTHFWEIPVSDQHRIETDKIGSNNFQNKEGRFNAVARENTKKVEIRHLSTDWFYKVTPDGEKMLRSWLTYSKEGEMIYCFCCCLFANSVTGTSSKFITGFQQ